jgi:hypothetical protein
MPRPSAATVGSWLVEFLNGYEKASFRKSGDHVIINERTLLKVLKFFLLAKYPAVQPEIRAHNNGRIDFGFDSLAVEVAVKNKSGKGSLLVGQNDTEMVKLRRHHGPACLALINMEKDSADYLTDLIDDYRSHSLGKGNHKHAKPIVILAIARRDETYEVQRHVLRAPI